MAVAYGEIARVLDGARRRQVRIILGTGAGFGLAAALLVLLAGAIALYLGARPITRPAAIGAAGVVAVAAAALTIRALIRSAWTAEATARSVAREEPGLRSDLLSSVELSRARPEIAAQGRYSLALLDAHVARTAERARALDLARALPDVWSRRAGMALVGSAGVTLLALALGGTGLGRAYSRLLAGDPAGTPAPALDPITGDIELTFQYPAYMHRDPRTISGTGGEIHAPKGTEVRLRTRADRPVKVAEIVVDTASSARPSTPGPQGGPYAQGERTTPSAPGARSSTSGPQGGPYAQGERTTPSAPGARSSTSGPQGGPYAQGERTTPSAPGARSSTSGPQGGERKDAAPPASPAPSAKHLALQISGDRDLSGGFVVEQGGTYRFRFLDPKGKPVAEGPPIPVVIEPDEFPQVRITAPEQEVEVEAGSVVHVDWQAQDDYGLGELVLVTKPPAGEEQRRTIRKFDLARRDSGTVDLDLGPQRLGEGEKLLYWLEVTDSDVVSGPKKGASATQVVKIYSEAEHRRQALEKAKAALEEMIGLLGDRLETLTAGNVLTPERLPVAEALDLRARRLHERLRQVAGEIRKDPAAPRELPAALVNLAGTLRLAEARLTAARQTLGRMFRARVTPDAGTLRGITALDAQLDAELEKGVLYLEQLLDKRRAEDLVHLAKDLAARRRDLAGLLERYQKSPSETAKKEVLAQIARMKDRMRDLMSRMAELAKGFNDEHMNAEAMAELAKSNDMMGGLDEVEKKLAQGDVEGAMKALDQLGGSMEKMLASLQRTAGVPDEKSRALMKEMLAFKKELEDVQAEQQKVAGETQKVRSEYRKKLSNKVKGAEAETKRLEKLAEEARQNVESAEPGLSLRAEPDFDSSKDGLADLQRALQMRDFDAALDTVQRALPSLQRLSMMLEEDAAMAERFQELTKKDPARIRDAQREASKAVPKATEIRDQLAKLFPDPRSVLGQKEQQQLQDLSKKQSGLEKRAGELQGKLSELMQKAPIFPPSASGQLGDSRGHMGQAAMELGEKNPQRGHGEQELAMDALSRFKKGLEQASKGGGGGGGFPFPFLEQGTGGEQPGEGMEPSREKVKIPGAEAYKVPEEFRKDLLDAMKQGAPERYKGEVQRYYEELVK